MDWFMMPAPFPGPMELDVGGAAALAAVLVASAVCLPGWLAVRNALRSRTKGTMRPRRRVRVAARLVAARGGNG